MNMNLKHLDKSQLTFVVEVMIKACIDTVKDVLPTSPLFTTSEANAHREVANLVSVTAVTSLGWNLSILYAQTSDGDGISPGDAIDIVGICKHVGDLIAERLDKNWQGLKVGEKVHSIDTVKLAENFVNKLFPI